VKLKRICSLGKST